MKALKKIGAIALILALVLTCFAACTPEAKLKGAWRDSTGVYGFEFKDGGIVNVTYLNATLPIIGTVNGNYDGTYTVVKNDDGSHSVTINYTLLTFPQSKTYKFDVSGKVLTLTDEDGTVTTYMAYEAPATTASSAAQ